MADILIESPFNEETDDNQIGFRDARRRMFQLDFDPLDTQIKLFHKLKEELDTQEKIRKGELIQLDSEGRRRKVRYSGVAHMSVLVQLQKIANDLMRYKYGRVPEKIEHEVKEVSGITLMLETSDGNYEEIEDDT